MMEMQRNLTGLLGPDMLGYLVDVVHQLHGMAESVSIDVLDQERLGLTLSQDELALIGSVHIAHLNGFVAHKGAFNAEQAANLLQFLIHIH